MIVFEYDVTMELRDSTAALRYELPNGPSPSQEENKKTDTDAHGARKWMQLVRFLGIVIKI